MQKYRLLAVAGILIGVLVQNARAMDPDMARFVGAKLAEARKAAGAQTDKVPSFVWSYFDAVRVDDWQTATNLANRIEAASGRFSIASNDTEKISPGLQSVIWPPISETIGVYEQFHIWDNKWLHRFGTNIINSIPRGSVYFGGTDPGRFVISALVPSQREGHPFFILTQNQLVDASYLAYVRAMYGGKVHFPDTNDVQQAFIDYSEDAERRYKLGEMKPGEDVRRGPDGRIRVTGQTAVMEINGRVAKILLDKNPGRNFYIEESFVLDWMYPQLSPHGLIMQLNHQPLPRLQREEIENDTVYWKRVVGDAVGDWVDDDTSIKDLCSFADKVYLRKDYAGFKGDVAYAKNEEAEKCFSKLRGGHRRHLRVARRTRQKS